jgi:hypothetical protein
MGDAICNRLYSSLALSSLNLSIFPFKPSHSCCHIKFPATESPMPSGGATKQANASIAVIFE